MHGRCYLTSGSKMSGLIVKEDVRLQDIKDKLLFNAAQKECVICHDAPTFKGIDGSFVRWRITRSDN